MGVPPIRVLSCFTGGGGLDRGLALAEPRARTVCYMEIEAFAIALLAHQIENKAIPAAPIWSDIATFDGKPWRGAVDMVMGGFPCTDISSAGRREGIQGEHSGLWFDMARVIRDVGPRVVFLENVGAIVVRGLDTVLGTLADLRFDAVWTVLSAAEVGATHKRDRWFCLAVANTERSGDRAEVNGHEDVRQDTERSASGPRGSGNTVVANAASERPREAGRVHSGQTLRPGRSVPVVADADTTGRSLERGSGLLDREWRACRDDPDGCERTPMANPPDGGWRERGQSPRSTGQPDGSRQAVGNTVRGGLRTVGVGQCPTPDATQPDESMGDASGQRLAERLAGVGATGDVLADAAGERGSVEPPFDGRESTLVGPEPGADGRAFSGHPAAGVRRPLGAHAAGEPGLPQFPPGPADQRAWNGVIDAAPWLAPALTQSDLRGVADGLALADRVDLLRLLGNGVVISQAEHAYRSLRDRLVTEGIWPL